MEVVVMMVSFVMLMSKYKYYVCDFRFCSVESLLSFIRVFTGVQGAVIARKKLGL